jgi:uncharacterized membrane protein
MKFPKIVKIIVWIPFAFSLGYAAYIRFSNPALTETQLFLNFWPSWIMIVLVVIIGYMMVSVAYRK